MNLKRPYSIYKIEQKYLEFQNLIYFKEDLYRLCEEKKDIIVDMVMVEYIDSSAVGMLLTVMQKLKRYDCYTHLINVTPGIKQTLLQLHANQYMCICENNRLECIGCYKAIEELRKQSKSK